MIEIMFLGTSSMVPTKERNHSAVFLRYKNEGILIDCGEGTQRQFKVAGIPITKVTKILITHWHGDHTLGLPGLIQSLGASEYSKRLEIFGPRGTKKHFEHMFKAFIFDQRIELVIKEVDAGIFFENKEFVLEAFELEHGTKTLGYRFTEKDRRKIDIKKVKNIGIPEGPLLGKLQDGKTIDFNGKKISPKESTYILEGRKIGFISDTVQCNNCIKIAKDVDVLICESTYHSKLEEKGGKYGHLTAKQAAMIANKANVKRLVLTHFSARYKSSKEVEEDAKDHFNNVVAAYDFMKVRL